MQDFFKDQELADANVGTKSKNGNFLMNGSVSPSKISNKVDVRRMDHHDGIEMFEGGKVAASVEGSKNVVSRQDILYDDDESGEDEGEQEDDPEELESNNGLRPNAAFKSYQKLFKNLTKSKLVVTLYPIVTCMISYDSTRAITVTKKDDTEFWVRMYDLETYQKTFDEQIGGQEEDYIRIKEVEQNYKGDKYAFVYANDGNFKLRVFGKQRRDESEIQENEFDINKALDINNYTMPIQGFADPFSTCSFIDDDRIFVQLFYNFDRTHWHFIYDHSKRAIEGAPFSQKLVCSAKNFPYKSFYNTDDNEIYSFYRQGEAFIVHGDDAQTVKFEKMADQDLGYMYLINNKALVARSSSKIVFFKIVEEEDENDSSKTVKFWKQYNQLDVRGFIYFIKGNKRIQVTTDDKIYFYLIDPETFEPTLENVMFNFMGCNQMMFGSRVRYGITYKTNQKAFTVYRRKFVHDFRVPISSENLEGSRGLDLSMHNPPRILVSKIDKIFIIDAETFQKVGEIPIKLLKTETREPNQIISMTLSKNQNYLAVISGKNLVMKQQKVN